MTADNKKKPFVPYNVGEPTGNHSRMFLFLSFLFLFSYYYFSIYVYCIGEPTSEDKALIKQYGVHAVLQKGTHPVTPSTWKAHTISDVLGQVIANE